MTAGSYFLYGVLQGILEFLPISSSGNFSLLRTFFVQQLQQIPNAMEWMLHGASFCALFYVLKREITLVAKSTYVQMLQPGGGFVELANRPAVKYFLFLVISTIPSVYVGKYWNIQSANISLGLSQYCFELGLSFIVTSSILWGAFFLGKPTTEPIADKGWIFPVIVGIAQAIGVCYMGVSRSGMCLSTCLLLGVQPTAAFRYTFFLAMPLYIGAFFKGFTCELVGWESINREVFFWMIGSFGVCFIVSVLSLYAVKILWERKYKWILVGCAIYTSFLSLVCIIQAYKEAVSL